MARTPFRSLRSSRVRPTPERVRMRRYFALMGTCLTLVVLSWVVVRPFSTTLSVVLGIVAMVIPPFAAIVANWDTGYGPDADDRRVDRRAATRLDGDLDGGDEARRGEG